MKQLHHPHVMVLHDFSQSDNHIYMVLECASRRTLRRPTIISTRRHIPPRPAPHHRQDT